MHFHIIPVSENGYKCPPAWYVNLFDLHCGSMQIKSIAIYCKIFYWCLGICSLFILTTVCISGLSRLEALLNSFVTNRSGTLDHPLLWRVAIGVTKIRDIHSCLITRFQSSVLTTQSIGVKMYLEERNNTKNLDLPELTLNIGTCNFNRQLLINAINC